MNKISAEDGRWFRADGRFMDTSLTTVGRYQDGSVVYRAGQKGSFPRSPAFVRFSDLPRMSREKNPGRVVFDPAVGHVCGMFLWPATGKPLFGKTALHADTSATNGVIKVFFGQASPPDLRLIRLHLFYEGVYWRRELSANRQQR